MNTKTKVILSFVTIFFLGGVSGYLVRDSFLLNDRYSQNEKYNRDRRSDDTRIDSEQERRAHREQMRERAQQRLTRYLELGDDQQGEFFNLLESYHTEIRDSVRTIRSLENAFVRDHYDEFKQELDDVLNDQQLSRMDRFFHPDSVRHNRMNRNHRN